MNKFRLMSVFVILAMLFGFANVSPAAAVGPIVSVTLQEGTATYSQSYTCCALPVDQAVDGIIIYGVGNLSNLNGWGIHPAVGQNHTAVWETSSDINATQLDFNLYQLWGGAHNLGHFRLSYTTDDRSTFADGLNEGGDVTANWTVLTGATITSTGGETFTELGDNSILASGNNPDTTVYSVSFSGSFNGITGIRLEALSDVSLPYGGPGRQANGNFTLTEITLDATLNESPTAAANGPYLVAVDQQVMLDSTGSSDPDLDPLTETWTAAGGTVSGNVYTAGSVPGIYDVQLVVNDGMVDSLPVTTMVVVYDPSGGFVTGGGWIISPAGALVDNPSATGKAEFGFVAKYKKGANVPSGNTEFQFEAGEFHFHSTSYQWLVVAGAKAQFKGEGTVEGSNHHYGFMLTAIDGQINGGGNVDKFRLKVWDMDNGDAIVYDNQIGGADDADPSKAISKGSIVIHKK